MGCSSEWLPSFFTFPLSRGYAFPPFRRPAAAGKRGPPGTGDVRHDMACALPPPGGGGKRGVWCSKVHRLIEAELFAAERCRPAPDGRALSCAAVDARKIHGSSATYKLKNARNRAPVSPVSPRDQRESRRKGGFGGVRGGKGTIWCPCPLLPRPVGTGISAARRRHIGRYANREVRFSSKNVAFSLALCTQHTV